MEVKVTKLTDVSLLRRANSFTTSKDSQMDLKTAYRLGHSPIRTQIFWVELTDIPLFVASQLVRSHVGVQFFQRSKRTDRGGEDLREVCDNLIGMMQSMRDASWGEMAAEIESLPARFDRYAPTDLAFIINAEALINMAHKRLCSKASKETREVMQKIRAEVEKCDPDISRHLVPQCWYRGGICCEIHPCGINQSSQAIKYYNQF